MFEIEKYKTQEQIVVANSFLKKCWLKEKGSQFMNGVIPIIEGVYFDNNQENILTHLAIVNGNY